MEFPLMVHGISKSHCISVGNNGTATMTVNTTVCLLGRKKERNMVTNLSSIMGNGHSGVFMESRFLIIFYLASYSLKCGETISVCSCALPILISSVGVSRNLFLWLSLLSILPCSFIVGYRFSSLLIIICL